MEPERMRSAVDTKFEPPHERWTAILFIRATHGAGHTWGRSDATNSRFRIWEDDSPEMPRSSGATRWATHRHFEDGTSTTSIQLEETGYFTCRRNGRTNMSACSWTT